MPKRLSLAQIERYWEEGCVFPIRVMSEADAVEHRALLEEFERRTGGPLKGDLRHKSHLLAMPPLLHHRAYGSVPRARSAKFSAT